MCFAPERGVEMRPRHSFFRSRLRQASVLATAALLLVSGLAVSSAQARRVRRADAGEPSAPVGTWSLAASMRTARTQFYASPQLPNGKVLVAGGADPSGHALASAELYDPATNT